VLIYPPFVFFQFVNEIARIIFFSTILIALFIYQITCSIKRNRISKILVLWGCLIVYFISSIIVNGKEGARTSTGYAFILAFAIILFSIFQSEKKNNFFKYIFNMYKILFLIIPIFCLSNFLLNLISPSVNILTPYFSNFTYNYLASPFGLSIPKSILGINFSRNFFFFIEPVYISLFYLINVFIIGKHIPKNSRLFINLNILGGLLTASYFFFLGYLILLFINMSFLKKVLIILISFFSSFFFYNTILNFFSESSSEERLSRLQIGIEIIKNYDLEKLFFGIGYLFDHETSKGVSSGLFTSFIEGGIIGLLIPLLFAILLCQRNKQLILIVCLSLILFEPYKMPFFWYVIILAGNLSLGLNSKNHSIKRLNLA
jgi:hypothetical protein